MHLLPLALPLALATLAPAPPLRGPLEPGARESAQEEALRRALAIFEVWLEETARKEALPAVTAAIVHDQELVWSGAVGFADAARTVPATPKTPFRIGSITKTFTATAVLQLRDAGKLRLDDDVKAHVPWLAATTSIRHLLAHGSGLARELPGEQWDTGVFPDRDAFRALARNAAQPFPPGERFKYSNVGYAIAGEVVERVAQRSWDDVVRARILEPLRMTSTRTRAAPDDPTVATGFGGFDASGKRIPMRTSELNAFAPAGGMVSTAEDLARWVSFQLRGDARVLSKETLREMQRPVVVRPDWSGGAGLGWSLVAAQERGETVTRVVHTGGVRGFRALVTFDPESRIGFIVLASADTAQPGAFAEQFWKLVAPPLARAKRPPPPKAPQLARYAGRYQWRDRASAVPADTKDFLIVVDEDRLAFVDIGDDPWGDRVRLAPVSGAAHTFQSEGGIDAGDFWRFDVDAKGDAVRVVTGGWSARRVPH